MSTTLTKIEYSLEEANHAIDEFLTPPKLIESMVILTRAFFSSEAELQILDPGANLGQFSAVMQRIYPNSSNTGVELMNVGKPSCCTNWYPNQDFTEWETEEKFDLIVGNPPYSRPKRNIAELFVRKSLALLKPDGMLFFLLRTNFGNAKGRARGLFKEFPLFQMYFVDRPSFYEHDPRTKHFGKKKSNQHDYSIYVWRKDYVGIPELHWLQWSDTK